MHHTPQFFCIITQTTYLHDNWRAWRCHVNFRGLIIASQPERPHLTRFTVVTSKSPTISIIAPMSDEKSQFTCMNNYLFSLLQHKSACWSLLFPVRQHSEHDFSRMPTHLSAQHTTLTRCQVDYKSHKPCPSHNFTYTHLGFLFCGQNRQIFDATNRRLQLVQNQAISMWSGVQVCNNVVFGWYIVWKGVLVDAGW